MPEENLPSEEEIERGKKAVDILTQLSDVLLDNLNINRENVDAINDSVKAAKDLTAPYKLTKEAAKEINRSNRDLAGLNAKLVNQEKDIADRKRSSKDISKDLIKTDDARKRLITEKNELDKKGFAAVKAGKTEEAKVLMDISNGLAAQVSQANDMDIALQKELESAKRIEKSFGLSGKALTGVNKLLGGALPDLDKIKEGARDQLESLEKENNLREGLPGKMQGFGAIVKSTGGL